MTNNSCQRILELMIGPNESIRDAISSFIKKHGWKKAAIYGAIGSIRDVVLSAPVGFELPPTVVQTSCDGPGEVLAFTGEVMEKESMDLQLRQIYSLLEEELFIHIHVSLAVAGGQVWGGGLLEGRTFRGLKVYIACKDPFNLERLG